VTLGIDLATQNRATAVCRVEWTDKSAVATVLPGGPKGEVLAEWCESALTATAYIDPGAPWQTSGRVLQRPPARRAARR